MRKLTKVLKAIGAVVANPWLLNHVLADDDLWQNELRKKGYPEKGLPVVDPDVLFPDFQETLSVFAFLDGGSLPTDLALLKLLARRFPACRYFEIGTWRGESVANVADVAAHCTTLNLSEEALLRKGFSKKYAELQGFFSQKKDRITHLKGDSLSFDFAGLGQKYDLIFIDGDHHFESVKSDTQQVFAHLVHEKSIVVWHDYAYHPEKMRPEVFAALWEGTPEEKRTHLVHVGHTLCAIYLPEKTTDTHPLEAPVVPRLNFRLTIDSRKI